MVSRRVFEEAQRFIYRNARPLDLARWKYLFEGGSPEAVLTALEAYQNADGGFGHALETDNWNPESMPMGVWKASTFLWEVGFADAEHPIIKGMLRYLDSGVGFSDGKWCNTVPSNNLYPHAVWWHCSDVIGVPSDNPTVSLAGFILRFARKDSSVYQKAGAIAKRCVSEFMERDEGDNHILRCYLDFLLWCEQIENFSLFDMDVFRSKLFKMIDRSICSEVERWKTEYVCKPSSYMERTGRIFQIVDRSLCCCEAEQILHEQLSDGSWKVAWKWYNDYKEWEISENWAKSAIILENLLYCNMLPEDRK